jgi:excisionase family DNA binding protein
MDVTKLFDVAQAAQVLGLHPGTVYRLARARRLPCIRIGPRVVRFDPRALDRFLRQNTVEVREGLRS